MKLTKQIKQNWIDACESGKFIQGTGQLRNNEDIWAKNKATHCCLGVLAVCMNKVIDDWGMSLLKDEGGYQFFYNLLGEAATSNLMSRNDSLIVNGNPRDYSNVLPIIKALPTID